MPVEGQRVGKTVTPPGRDYKRGKTARLAGRSV